MKIKLSKSVGYCLGVRRAMDMALKNLGPNRGPVYTHGPLIHNPQALNLLAGKGLKIYEPPGPPLGPGDTLIIRAHGLPPCEQTRILKFGCRVQDATCPRVVKVQRLVNRYSLRGYQVIIWGAANHPEVIGLAGYSNHRGVVVKNAAEVRELPDYNQVILVAQTTQAVEEWEAIAYEVTKRWPPALIFNTICEATISRQAQVVKLAAEVEAMIIVGGKESGNTRRLAEVASQAGLKTLMVEDENEIDPKWLSGLNSVGVTAGASTPNWMIKRVIGKLESLNRAESSWPSFFHRLLRALILSNIYVAAGAGALGLAIGILAQKSPSAFYFSLFFCHVQAMHTLNVFCDRAASKFNDPERAQFLEKYRPWLMLGGFITEFGALTAAFHLGPKVLALFIFMSALGLLFSLPVIPGSLSQKFGFSRLKDMPASKAASVAAGWALLITAPPYLATGAPPLTGLSFLVLILTGSLVFLNVFIRGTLVDILEVQGDRIFGRETLPIIFGEKKALKILKIAAILWALILGGGLALNFWPSVALVMLASPLYYLLLMTQFNEHYAASPILLEAFLDAPYFLTGLLALLWYALI